MCAVVDGKQDRTQRLNQAGAAWSALDTLAESCHQGAGTVPLPLLGVRGRERSLLLALPPLTHDP